MKELQKLFIKKKPKKTKKKPKKSMLKKSKKLEEPINEIKKETGLTKMKIEKL